MTDLPDTNAYHQVLVAAFDGYEHTDPKRAPDTLGSMIREDPEAALAVLDLGAERLANLTHRRLRLLQAVVSSHEAAARRVLEEPELRAVPGTIRKFGLIYPALEHHRSVAMELLDHPEVCRRPYGRSAPVLMWAARIRKDADLALAALERPEFDDLRGGNLPWPNTLVGWTAFAKHREALLKALRPGGRLREQGRLADLVAILVEDAPPLARKLLEDGRLDPASWPQRARLALLQAEDEELREQGLRATGADAPEKDPPSGPTA